jgi:hypothetical protein
MRSFRLAGVRQIEGRSSRLFVAISASPFDVNALASFCAKGAVFAPFSAEFVQICTQNAHNLQHSKK